MLGKLTHRNLYRLKVKIRMPLEQEEEELVAVLIEVPHVIY
jgi:hypothetical protein